MYSMSYCLLIYVQNKMHSVVKWKLWKFIIALTTFHCAYAQKAELSNVDNITYPRSYICL